MLDIHATDISEKLYDSLTLLYIQVKSLALNRLGKLYGLGTSLKPYNSLTSLYKLARSFTLKCLTEFVCSRY